MPQRNELVSRTRNFAYGVYHLVQEIRINIYNKQLIEQLIDCSFSVPSNYRASQRAKSKRDFINKLKIVLEEVDEANFWLACFKDLKISNSSEIDRLFNESNELISIFVTIINKMGDT